MLTKFWINFDSEDKAILTRLGLGLGVGVTAYDMKDAITILGDAYDYLPAIKDVIKDVRYDDLEAKHVKLNMGNMAVRGIWYPNLNSS